MSNPQRSRSARELIYEAFDGTLADKQLVEFAQSLRDNPQLMKEYVDAALLHAQVYELVGSRCSLEACLSSVECAAIQSSRRAGSGRSLVSRALKHQRAVGIAVAAMFMVSMLGWAALTYLPGVAKRGDQRRDTSAPTPGLIATLTNWHRPEWVKGHAISPRNHRIRVGQEIAFTSGLVELTYDTGAKVVIEGPAEFVVGGTAAPEDRNSERKKGDEGIPRDLSPRALANSGFLKRGKLVARCDTPESERFTIVTPLASVADLGTEFGVVVRDDGDIGTHVFDGKVVLAPRGGATWSRRELLAGQSLRVDRSSAEVLSKARQIAAEFQSVKLLKADEMPPVGTDVLAVNIDDGVNPLQTRLPLGYRTYDERGQAANFVSNLGVDRKVGVRVDSEYFRNIKNSRYGVVTSLVASGDPAAGYNAIVNSGALVNHESKGPITVTLSGLKAGSYQIRFFMHGIFREDSEGRTDQGLWDISGTVDAENVRATFGFNRPATNNGLPPKGLDDIGQTTLGFKLSKGGDDATFVFRAKKLTASRQLWVNGFELTSLTATEEAAENSQP
ncbi:MAG: hypothetical protein MI757_10635 [Pirellulales bacterium]|nr:hypothetical protein [Pirellulales bacterium]